MTDTNQTPAPEKAPPAKAKPPRRTWKQRFKILILIVLIGIGLFRIALNLLLPTVIDKVAGMFGLDVGYQRLSLSLLGGTAHIWGLEVRPKEGGDSIANCDYIEGNLAPLELLRGRLVVYRAEVDGVALTIERAADGSIPLLQKIAAAQTQSATPAVAIKNNATTTPMSLAAPLRVDAIRLHHVTVKLRDRSVTPVFEATVRTDLRVSDVGVDKSPTTFELNVGVDPLLDTLRLTGEAHTSPTALKADVKVLLRGLHPKAAAGYLAQLGLRPVADSMTIEANASFNAQTIPKSADFKASLVVDDVKAVADEQEWASLSSLTLDAKKAGTAGLELGTLFLSDGFASARRTADGHVQLAGVELAPGSAGESPAPATQPAATVVVTSGPAFHVSLDVLDLKRLQANLTDYAVRPTAALVARLDSLCVQGFDSASKAPLPISLSAALPGIVKAVSLTGQAAPLAPTKTIQLALRAKGIKPDLLAPYLERFGLTSKLSDGRFSADVAAAVSTGGHGNLTADARATAVRFADGDEALIELDTARAVGVSYSAQAGAIGVKSIEVVGPRLSVSREADGRIRSAGFTFMPPPASPTQVSVSATNVAGPSTAPATAPATASPFVLPRIEINQFAWSGVRLTLTDEAATPATNLVVNDAGVQLDDLVLDLAAQDKQKPGTFRAWLKAPGLANHLSATGVFTPAPGRFALDAILTGDGLRGAPLVPYLKPLGIEPTLQDGHFNARATALLTQTDGKIAADFDLRDATYADGGTELAGVDSLHVSGVSPKTNRVDIAELLIVRPRARVAREADGTLRAGGIHLIGTPPSTQPAVTSASPSTAAAARPMLNALPIELGLKKLRVESATLDWIDAAAPISPATVHFVGGVSLDDFDVSPAARPATLHVTASIDGSLKSATVDGTITPSPVAPAVDVHFVADGLAAGPLAAYLPATLAPAFKAGHLETKFSASAANHNAGGLVARVNVTGLRFSDPAGSPGGDLLKVDQFTLAANRIDPAGDVFAIGELTSSGVALDVSQTPAGLQACGVRLVTAPVGRPSTQPADSQVAAAPMATPVGSLASIVGDARRPLPAFSIDKLDLGVARIGLSGFTGPGAAPLVLNDLHVAAPSPIAIGGRRADPDASVSLNMTGGVEPVVHHFSFALTVKPMASEPSVTIDLAAKGIRGDGLLAVLPALKAKIDASQLTDGELNTRADATVRYGRRGPRDFDLGRGFTAEFNVKPVAFRTAAGQPVVAGIEAMRGDGIKVEPASGNVAIKSLDISTPILRAYRDDAGIHVIGLTVKLGAAEPVENLAPASQPATQADAQSAAPPPAPAAAPVAAGRPKNEIRLDHLTVSGIDAVIEDRTTEPKTIVPLKSLDLDVRDLSNQLPWSGKSARFSLLVTGGKVPLPPRKGIEGQVTTRPSKGGYTEQRELFSQVTASGKIGFARSAKRDGSESVALEGWTKTAVNGFELLGVRGLAKPYGVTIGGGSFDDTNDVRFHPDGVIETKTKIVFTNLSLSEAANGPLKRLLKLPAPIDVAIGAVTDPDGSITLNLPVPIKNGAVTASDVAGPALGAITNVLITGIASAPLKAVGGVTDLLGFGSKEAKPDPPVTIDFLPGYDGLDADARRALTTLAAQMKDDENLELQCRHSLTDPDVSRIATRVNPSPEQALALAARVRQQKGELLGKRDTLAAQARGDLGADAATRAKTTLASLRAVSEQIAKADTALDDLYALTGPGAALQADRRTRAACLELGHRRLDAVRSALVDAGVTNVDGRVHSTNPQFDPAPDAGGGGGGGAVTVTLIRKKH